MLLAAGAAAVAAVAGAGSAQSTGVSGTVEFEGGAAIPKGEVEIYIEASAAQDDALHPPAMTRAESDGRSGAIDFSLTLPADATASPRPRVVARLERADGWLLARGSAQLEIDSPVRVVLHPVMY